MSLIRSLMAKGGMNFAHLGGIAAGKPRSAASDKDGDKEDDKPGNDAKGSKAEGDDDKKDGDKEDDKPGNDAKGSKAEAEDDDEEEMRGKSAAASARRRERARCAAIFGSRAAGRNPVLAANLAFNTSMTRNEAIVVLEGTPAAQSPGARNAERAQSNPRVDPVGGAEPGAQSKHAANLAAWDAVRTRNKSQGG